MRFVKCAISDCSNNAHHDAAGRVGYCCMHYKRLKAHGDPTVVKKVPSPAKDWILSHKNYQGDECLTWPFAIGKDGYGRVHERGTQKLQTASRAMCIAAHGEPLNTNYEAAHKCGNGHKGCTNPRHIYWATPATNHADKVVHGTTNRGERQWKSKLTETDVMEIRRLLNTESQASIAKKYGVDPSHISDIKRGKKWGWL